MKKILTLSLTLLCLFTSTAMSHEPATKLSGQFCKVDTDVVIEDLDEEMLKIYDEFGVFRPYQRTGIVFAQQCERGDVTVTKDHHEFGDLITVCDLDMLKILVPDGRFEGLSSTVMCVYKGKQLSPRSFD